MASVEDADVNQAFLLDCCQIDVKVQRTILTRRAPAGHLPGLALLLDLAELLLQENFPIKPDCQASEASVMLSWRGLDHTVRIDSDGILEWTTQGATRRSQGTGDAARLAVDLLLALRGEMVSSSPLAVDVLAALRAHVLQGATPPPGQGLPPVYVEAFKEACASANLQWLDRALTFYHIMTTEFKELGFPSRVYGSEAGAHLAWSLLTIHLFIEADEDDDPDLVYSLQIFDSRRQTPSRSVPFRSARDVLTAALAQQSVVSVQSAVLDRETPVILLDYRWLIARVRAEGHLDVELTRLLPFVLRTAEYADPTPKTFSVFFFSYYGKDDPAVPNIPEKKVWLRHFSSRSAARKALLADAARYVADGRSVRLLADPKGGPEPTSLLKYVSWAPSPTCAVEASLAYWAPQFSYGKALERLFCHPLVFVLPVTDKSSQYILCRALQDVGVMSTAFSSTFKFVRSSGTVLFVVYFRSVEARRHLDDLFQATTSSAPAVLKLKAGRRIIKTNYQAVARLLVAPQCPVCHDFVDGESEAYFECPNNPSHVVHSRHRYLDDICPECSIKMAEKQELTSSTEALAQQLGALRLGGNPSSHDKRTSEKM